MTYWYQTPCPVPSKLAADKALARQQTLTKPAGSLGELENIAIQFAAWQGTEKPSLENIMVRVFAADHGIYAQNVSAFPQEVTMQMVLNFISGGAAISVLSEHENTNFSVVNMGIATSLPDTEPVRNHPQLIDIDIAAGTADFSITNAMTAAQTDQALLAGQSIVKDNGLWENQLNSDSHLDSNIDSNNNCQLFIGGEMGIANTSSASAIYCALLGISPTQACGPGTGLDADGVSHKASVIEKALKFHHLHDASSIEDLNPHTLLQQVGGFEITALAGAYIAAAQQQTPSLIDGFISTAAALIAVKLNPSCRDWLLFSHQSAEPAHILALDHLNAKPLLNLGMRLGEGSGAAVCIPLLRSALVLHNNMATFAEAAVADKS